MTSAEPSTVQPSLQKRGVGSFGILVAVALAYVVLSTLGPDVRGGLLIVVVAPILFLVLWAVVSSILTLCILSRPDGRLRSGAGIGYGLLLIIAVLCVSFFIVIQQLNHQGQTYHGP